MFFSTQMATQRHFHPLRAEVSKNTATSQLWYLNCTPMSVNLKYDRDCTRPTHQDSFDVGQVRKACRYNADHCVVYRLAAFVERERAFGPCLGLTLEKRVNECAGSVTMCVGDAPN